MQYSIQVHLSDALYRTLVTGVLVATVFVSIPMRTMAQEEVVPTLSPVTHVGEDTENDYRFTLPNTPASNTMKVVSVYKGMTFSAYTSRVEECDDTPFITADGSYVRDGIVATNFLPFGTKIRIPELFGDKVFEVHDRMNKRYQDRVDIWMNDLGAARKFGIRHATIEVVKVVEKS
jgi:3D (Asp-Asp-Asp) domain-containing protein